MADIGLSRRAFIGRGAAVAGAGLFTAGALETLLNRTALAGLERSGENPYGPLSVVADQVTGQEYLALPEGFSYVTFGHIGVPMSDGHPTPLALDGMAAFEHPTNPDLIRLIRNHEDRGSTAQRAIIVEPEEAPFVHDPNGGGGCTTLDFDPATGELVQDFVSLKGTIVNCAGGYGFGRSAWLSGEETTGTRSGVRHGYVFSVPVDRGLGDMPGAEPIIPMGRFSHEAVATDQRNGIVYQTDDPGSGVGAGFYRYIPDDPNDLHAGGRLQMLGVKDQPQVDLREGHPNGAKLPVVWYDIEDVDPASAANTSSSSVFAQGRSQGAAQFNRLEGCWWDGSHSVFFASTSGGDVKTGDVNSDGFQTGYGQIWRYRANPGAHLCDDPSELPDGEGELTMIYASDGAEALDSPDNICVTPRGGLMICEDDSSGDSDTHPLVPGRTNIDRLIGYSREGQVFEFAVNVFNSTEFAGATFSPDGQVLFVNIMGANSGSIRPYTGPAGMTIAITGPWNEGPL